MIATVTKRCVSSQARQLCLGSKPTTIRIGGNAPRVPSFRLHSNVTGRCPHRGSKTQAVNRADSTAASTKSKVQFVDVPKLPIFGSFIRQYSNAAPYKADSVYDFWFNNRKRFGDFFCLGMPALGKGMTGDIYIMTDPNEMMKVLRKEGIFPIGVLAFQWPFVEYYNDAIASGSRGAEAGAALFSRGSKWQRIRRFMQTDLTHPTAAKGYVPGMIRACQIVSEGAPHHAKDFKKFTAFFSFDVFSSIMFGEFTGLASGKSGHEDNERFCKASLAAVDNMNTMVRNPFLKLMKKLGIKRKIYSTFEENFSESRRIAHRKMKDFKRRKKNRTLGNDFEKMSYASLSIDRLLDSIGEEGALSEAEMTEILVVALIAALDTSSALLNWSIVHLAMNPGVQEELRKEVEYNVSSTGGESLTADCFTRSNNIYLDAFLRENQRMTSPVGFNVGKENMTGGVEIHGKTIPEGNMFILDSRSVGMDPDIVKDPDIFDPTRWFETEVQKRKGTEAEILDHPLYKAPYSAGARKCVGSRVANYEAKILLSQLVLDWKISYVEKNGMKPETWRDIKYHQGLAIQPVVPELSFERRS